MKNIKKLLRICDRKYWKTKEIIFKNLENLLENFEKFRKINSYFVLN